MLAFQITWTVICTPKWQHCGTKKALSTEEVANAVAFLLSPRSSGINAQRIVIDAGMGSNYFDREIVKKATKA